MARQSECSWTAGDHFLLIHGLYVAPKERGRGEARRLLSKTIEEARAASPGKPIEIVARAREEHVNLDRLVAFYESMGFQVDEVAENTVYLSME